jgi:hypothetical protein
MQNFCIHFYVAKLIAKITTRRINYVKYIPVYMNAWIFKSIMYNGNYDCIGSLLFQTLDFLFHRYYKCIYIKKERKKKQQVKFQQRLFKKLRM